MIVWTVTAAPAATCSRRISERNRLFNKETAASRTRRRVASAEAARALMVYDRVNFILCDTKTKFGHLSRRAGTNLAHSDSGQPTRTSPRPGSVRNSMSLMPCLSSSLGHAETGGAFGHAAPLHHREQNVEVSQFEAKT